MSKQGLGSIKIKKKGGKQDYRRKKQGNKICQEYGILYKPSDHEGPKYLCKEEKENQTGVEEI